MVALLRSPNRFLPPLGELELARGSAHARGAVVVVPLFAGPPRNLVDGELYTWSGTEPTYAIEECPLGRPIRRQTVQGNGSQYINTGRTYGLTSPSALTVEWWMAEDGSYLSGDLVRYIAGNRTASNTGWTCGRDGAVGGSPTNLTRLFFTIQGIAQYSSSFSISSRSWVHCCVTLNGTALRLYADGVQIGTATTGSMTTGQDVALLTIGTSPVRPWLNTAHSLVIRDVALSPEEVRLRANPVETWGLYRAARRRLYLIPKAAAAGAPDRELLGSVPWAWVPGAVFARERAVSGSVPWTWVPGAVFARARAVSGSVLWTWVPGAVFARARAVSGSVPWTWVPGAVFARAADRALSGSVSWTWAPAAALARERALSGAAAWTWAPAAGFDYTIPGARDLDGSVPWVWVPAGGFARVGVLAGPSPLLAQMAADFGAIVAAPDWLAVALGDNIMGFAREITLPAGTTTGLWQGARVASGEWRPAFIILSDGDAATITAGDAIEVDGVTYRAAGPAMPTGLGTSRVVLDMGPVP